MRKILQDLGECVGVRGCLLVTRDGIVIASELTADLEEESIGAIASSLVLSVVESLGEADFGAFEHYVIDATSGKMVLVDAEVAFLVVVTDKDINLDITMIDISGAAYRLKKAGQLIP